MDFLSSILDSKDEEDFDFMKDSKKSKRTPEFLNSNIKNCDDDKGVNISNLMFQDNQNQNNNFFCLNKNDNLDNHLNFNIQNQKSSQILDDFDIFKSDTFIQNKISNNNIQNNQNFTNNNIQPNKNLNSNKNKKKYNNIIPQNTIIEKNEEDDDNNSIFSLNNFQVNFSKKIENKNELTELKNNLNNSIDDKLMDFELTLKEKIEEKPKGNTPKKDNNKKPFQSPLNKTSPLLNHSLNYSDIPHQKVKINNNDKSPMKKIEETINNNKKNLNEDYHKLIQIINVKKEKIQILKNIFPIFEQLFITIENLKFEVPIFQKVIYHRMLTNLNFFLLDLNVNFFLLHLNLLNCLYLYQILNFYFHLLSLNLLIILFY